MWSELSRSEKEPYEAEYKKKADAYEKYMEEQGFKPRKASRNAALYEEKLSPMGKGVPDHIRAKRIRLVCSNAPKILPMKKAVYAGLGKVLVIFG